MPIKSILAAYSGDAAGSSGLGLAMFLARAHDAHLTGVVWRGPSPIESRFHKLMTRDVLDMLRRREAEAAAEIREGFEARLGAEGAGLTTSYIDLENSAEFSLSKCAQAYDLVVMGNRAAAVGREHMAARPDVVALRSGRPVILVPHDYKTKALGKKVVFAWDGKRAAARAIGDAIPLLAPGAEVTVLSIGQSPAGGVGDDMVGLLRRHGFEAHATVRSGGGGVSGALMAGCREFGADMMVMGAYEHSKFREDILGGVTQDILEGAHLPVLMSH